MRHKHILIVALFLTLTLFMVAVLLFGPSNNHVKAIPTIAATKIGNTKNSNFDNISKGSFRIYENSSTGIRMLYPANWTISNGTGNVTVVFSDHGKHPTGLAIMVGKLGNEQSFEKFMRLHLNQLKTIYFDPMGIFNASFKTTNITLARGFPAAKIEYSYVCAPDESSCDAFEVWTPHNNMIYEFRTHTIYHGGINPFDPQFLRTAQIMINSLEITK